MYDFAGKIAVISGGSQGIGRASAMAFAREGGSVAIAARTKENVDATVAEIQAEADAVGKGGRVLGVATDLSEVEGIKQFVGATIDVLGGVDVLLNNVGGSPMVPFLALTDAQIWDAWNLKLLGAIRLTQALVPIMEQRGGGSVINIGGGAGHDMAPELLLAATTINGVRAFTKAVAPDLAKRGIAVNVITPGPTRTDRHFGRARMMAERDGSTLEKVLEDLDGAVPTGHVTEPEEVAQLVLFLASRTVHNLTGAEITLDGGASRAW